jgi:hypothetical protein
MTLGITYLQCLLQVYIILVIEGDEAFASSAKCNLFVSVIPPVIHISS